MKNKFASTGAALLAAMTLGWAGHAGAAPVYYTVDLTGGPVATSPTPYISFVSNPQNSNGDAWWETVMKVTLGGANPYKFAQFRISYGGDPFGLSVNIGDSATNNGGSGDAGTQGNDAEMQIGGLVGQNANYPVLRGFGNDAAPAATRTVAEVAGFAAKGDDVVITVANNDLRWNNGRGTSGEVISPFLYALAGQADGEGPVNYDIYAAFNRVISDTSRIGGGVSQVTVCLSTDASCFNVPSPDTLSLMLAATGLLALRRRRT